MYITYTYIKLHTHKCVCVAICSSVNLFVYINRRKGLGSLLDQYSIINSLSRYSNINIREVEDYVFGLSHEEQGTRF